MSEEQKEEAGQPAQPEIFWQYPDAGDEPAPKGQNILLLTLGRTPTIGIWGAGFIAWAKFPQRDVSKEPQPYYKGYGKDKP